MPPVRPCIVRGCTEYTYASRCERHEAEWEKKRLELGATGRRGSTGSWKRQRQKAIVRDGRRCRDCGRSAQMLEGQALEVHHLDGDSSNHGLPNLLTCCPGCHREREATKRALQAKR